MPYSSFLETESKHHRVFLVQGLVHFCLLPALLLKSSWNQASDLAEILPVPHLSPLSIFSRCRRWQSGLVSCLGDTRRTWQSVAVIVAMSCSQNHISLIPFCSPVLHGQLNKARMRSDSGAPFLPFFLSFWQQRFLASGLWWLPRRRGRLSHSAGGTLGWNMHSAHGGVSSLAPPGMCEAVHVGLVMEDRASCTQSSHICLASLL